MPLVVAVAEEYDDYLTKQFFGRMVHTTRGRKPWQSKAFWRIMHLCERCSMVLVLLLSAFLISNWFFDRVEVKRVIPSGFIGSVMGDGRD